MDLDEFIEEGGRLFSEVERLRKSNKELLKACIDARDTIKYAKECVSGSGLSVVDDCIYSLELLKQAIKNAE